MEGVVQKTWGQDSVAFSQFLNLALKLKNF